MQSTAEMEQITQHVFGMSGKLTRLVGEYDENYHFRTHDGNEFLLKISPDSQTAVIDLQQAVLQHLRRLAVPFYVPELQPAISGAWRSEVTFNKTELKQQVRLLSYVPYQLFSDLKNHSPSLLTSLGQQLGRLSLALSRFKHAAARRYLKWDLLQWNWIKEELQVITSDSDRKFLMEIIQRIEISTVPLFPHFRTSVIHGDLNDHNILVSDDNTVVGFIDFGDLVESATIAEIAIAIPYAVFNQTDPLAAAANIVKSYHHVFPLQGIELDHLLNFIMLRLCVSVVNSAMRKNVNPDDAYLSISENSAWTLLKKLNEISAVEAASAFRSACEMDTNSIQKVRQRYIARNVSLSYEDPLHIVRGEGQYLFDVNGRRYLDCVNNINHVGHCHPEVIAAANAQMAMLNVNTRYLHENLTRYAQRLTATLPAPLEVCFLVNSGSEANELALRLAQVHTKQTKLAVLDNGYHGNTTKLINISPYKFNGRGGAGKPDDVTVVSYNDISAPCNFIAEAMQGCAGQVVLPQHFLQTIYASVRAGGGVCIADEVQTGLGRTGTHYWAFATQEVIPDIVTMGKPLGNGHPLGAVVTTREIADSFCNGMEYFNSFGGNPVSCAVGLAVLDVIANEKLQENALHVGNTLKSKLTELQQHYSCIKEVRGSGLFLGVEMHNAEHAAQIVNIMKSRGILLSADGPLHHHAVIKIKPPMVFNNDNCDEVMTALHFALSTLD